MDWKLEQRRQAKMKASKNNGADKNINVMVAMERDFTQIFGASLSDDLPRNRGKAGDPVRRSELTQVRKNSDRN